jgi:L-rhamnose mutarotase
MAHKNIPIMKKSFLFIACSLLLVSCGHKTGQQPAACPTVIEIIGTDSLLSLEALESLVQTGGLEINAYRWKNHWALYGVFPRPEEIQKQIEQAYPQAVVRWYDRPFYVFDRRQCDNGQAQRWEHTLMTANLTADTVLQQEYMEYHTRQSELFPEVAQGFCKADFQQLLVFRNGRQLMLVISIPEGESLNHLNPKTTENNPRADEWNEMMTQYQEGIEGASPGETWVTFDPVFENGASDKVPTSIPNPIDSIAVHSKRTADNTVPTKLSQTDTDDWTLMLLSLIAAVTGIVSVFLAWKTVSNTQKTVNAVQKETEQMQIKKEFQAKLFVDLIRHLYRNKVCICATLWKLKQHGFGKKYPSEEHLLKLKILPEDLRLDRFDNTPTHYDVLHELELKFRNFNYEVDVTLEHLKIKKLKDEQKIRDLSVLEFKQQLLSIDIVNVMRKLGLFAVAIELDNQQNPQNETSPSEIKLVPGKPYPWKSESEKTELLEFLNAVNRKLIDTHKRYEINNPTNNHAIQGIEREAKDEEKGLPDRRYYDDVLGLTQILDDDIRGEIPKIYLIEFPASAGRKKSVDK